MSSEAGVPKARAPKRARGKQRVAELLQAAAEVFAEKGYEAATMTEIAARAGAPIGSLYQFFPVKDALADWLVKNYIALLVADLQALEARASRIDTETLVDNLLGLLRAHERERAAAAPLVEARMDERTRRTTFRHMLRKQIAAILRVRSPTLSAEAAREMAVVLVSLMKAVSALVDEVSFPDRAAALRDLRTIAVQYIDSVSPRLDRRLLPTAAEGQEYGHLICCESDMGVRQCIICRSQCPLCIQQSQEIHLAAAIPSANAAAASMTRPVKVNSAAF